MLLALVVDGDDDRDAGAGVTRRDALAEQVPDVDDGRVGVEVAVGAVGRADDQEVGLGEDVVERARGRGRRVTYGSVHSTSRP